MTFTVSATNENVIQEVYNHRKGRWKAVESDPVWQRLPEDIGGDPEWGVDELYGILYELKSKHIPKFRWRLFFPKPWWNWVCKEAWRLRETCYRSFKATGNIEDKIKWKRARAKATRTFREERKREWQSYVGTLSINTKALSVGKKIRRIRGRPQSRVNILKENDIIYTSIVEITEKLAQSFQEITSNLNNDPQFLDYKQVAEQEQLDFESSNKEVYKEVYNG